MYFLWVFDQFIAKGGLIIQKCQYICIQNVKINPTGLPA